MDEFTPNMFMQNLLASHALTGALFNAYTSKPLGYTALEDVAESAAMILIEGPERHGGKDYWFSADALTPGHVAETLTVATGRKFTSAVRGDGSFQIDAAQSGSVFEPAYAKGELEFFRYVEDGRMVYAENCKRRYKGDSRSRAIGAEGMGNNVRQRVTGDCE